MAEGTLTIGLKERNRSVVMGQVGAGALLAEILCWEATRRVANDWTVVLGSETLQILRQSGWARPGERVTVRRRLGGSISVLAGARRLLARCIDPAPRKPTGWLSRPPRGAAPNP